MAATSPGRWPAARSSSSALATRRKRDDLDNYIQRDGLIEDDGAVDGGFEQTVKASATRRIGRLSWTRANLLVSRSRPEPRPRSTRSTTMSSCSEFDEDGSKVRIDLPIADATVKEKRGEIYVNLGKTLSPGAAHRRRRQLRILAT